MADFGDYLGRNDLEELANGFLYGDGGVSVDYDEALNVARAGAFGNEAWAYPLYGMLTTELFPAESNSFKLGTVMLKKGIEGGDDNCKSLLANALFLSAAEGSEDERYAVELLIEAAQIGNVDAIGAIARNRSYLVAQYGLKLPVPDEKYTRCYMAFVEAAEGGAQVLSVAELQSSDAKQGLPIWENGSWIGGYSKPQQIQKHYPSAYALQRHFCSVFECPRDNVLIKQVS